MEDKGTTIKKPELSIQDRQRANEVYIFMRNNKGYHTKEELCKVLGWEYPQKDRQIRELISNIAKVKPIISTSDNRGYKLAISNNDIEEARHQWAELSKRADEIMARCAPLIRFIEKGLY